MSVFCPIRMSPDIIMLYMFLTCFLVASTTTLVPTTPEPTIEPREEGKKLLLCLLIYLSHPSLRWPEVFSSFPMPWPQWLLLLVSQLFLLKYFWLFFFSKFQMCFIKVKHSIAHILRMIGLIDVKQRALVGYWVNCVPSILRRIGWMVGKLCALDFDLTHDLVLGFFKVRFLNSCISGIVGMIDVKRTGQNGLILGNKDQSTWNERDVNESMITMTVTLDDDGGVNRIYGIVTLFQKSAYYWHI